MGGTGEFHREGGGDTRWSSQMGGVYPSAAENGGGLICGGRPREKGNPPSACFWHLP